MISRRPAFLRLAADPRLRQFSAFVLVGLVTTASQYALLVAMVELGHVTAVAANIMSYLLSAIANYSLNRRFAFAGAQATFRRGLARFALISAIGLGLNTLIFTSLLQAGIYYRVAWALAVAIVVVWNFAGARFYVYRKPDAPEPQKPRRNDTPIV